MVTRAKKPRMVSAAGLQHSGIPLGGLGTGSVELRADGYFHEWQIMNNAPWGAGQDFTVPATNPYLRACDTAFFGLQVIGAGVNRTAVPGLTPPYDHILNMPYHAPFMCHATAIEADTRFPFTRLRYAFDNVPVDVELEAFSPFIPLDEKNSGLPLAFFSFTIRNRTAKKLTVSLVHAQRNLVAYDHTEKLSKVRFDCAAGRGSVVFAREDLDAQAGSSGSMAVGAFGPADTQFTYAAHTRTDRDLWEPLRLTGRLDNADHGEFAGAVGNVGAEGQAWRRTGLPYGLLCQTVTLGPRASRTLRAALAWHFPNMWERDHGSHGCSATRIGHRYASWFANAADVLEYGVREFESLRARSLAFVNDYYASSIPEWLKHAVNAQLTVLVKSSWWDEHGRFGIWEGLGCCGLQTTDITHYGSFPIALFFPEIQKSQMRLSAANVREKGRIPHMMPGTFGCCDADERGRIDLIPQFVLLVWRDVLWTNDLTYANEMWPIVADSIAFAQRFDSDGDGLPNNTGPDQTYDQFPLRGTSAFVGFLYAAALESAAQLGEMLGKHDDARRYRVMFLGVASELERQLWNGSWYRLSHDPHTGHDNEGVMADQINADWFVRQTTGKGILPDTHVKSALRAIVKYCTNRDHGYLANCAWPKGGAVAIGRHTADQANMPWTGVEYAVAAHLLLMGLDREGLAVTEGVWRRYERSGLRFNHIECGEHYYRALSAWAIYLAACGFALDSVRKTLTLRVAPKPSSWVLNLPSGWGAVRTARAGTVLRLDVREGTVELKSVVLRGVQGRAWKVSAGESTVGCTASATTGGVHIAFSEPVHVDAGRALTIAKKV